MRLIQRGKKGMDLAGTTFFLLVSQKRWHEETVRESSSENSFQDHKLMIQHKFTTSFPVFFHLLSFSLFHPISKPYFFPLSLSLYWIVLIQELAEKAIHASIQFLDILLRTCFVTYTTNCLSFFSLQDF